jgi:hypothetical protein
MPQQCTWTFVTYYTMRKKKKKKNKRRKSVPDSIKQVEEIQDVTVAHARQVLGRCSGVEAAWEQTLVVLEMHGHRVQGVCLVHFCSLFCV